jgi:type III pantothenate kinase
MIHLLIDAGNSTLKWTWRSVAVESASTLPAPGRLSWHGADMAGALTLAWSNAAPLLARGQVRAWACAVISDARREQLAQAWRALGGAGDALRWLASQDRFEHPISGLHNGYRDPARLGADRWHAMLGARARHPATVLVVVCAGTATTVDSIDREGRHLGGVIAPGVRLMHTSLARGTDRLGDAPGAVCAFPNDTADAIHTGVLDAQLGLIQERLRLTQAQTAAAPTLVLCGGHGPALLSECRARGVESAVSLEADLIFEGLWRRTGEQAA